MKPPRSLPGEVDVLVVGGGATGAGTALDLALRGLRVALVERGDLCEGTSGRYHGLLHSGGRYAVTDPESAAECIVENRIVRRIAPHAIEDTGGLFVTTPADDPDFADGWFAACRRCGIDAEEIPVREALRREPVLNPAISRAFTVPDGSCDSFDLVESLAYACTELGTSVWTYHRLVDLEVAGGRVAAALVESVRTGERSRIATRMVVNAAGAWAGRVAAMADCQVKMRPNKGAMIGMSYRFVNTVINRCHRPADGDILVPVGTVAAIGTTSVNVSDPDDTSVQAWEVQRMLAEGELMVPGFSHARSLRTWAGVRPLYEDTGAAEGRAVKRTFAVLKHAERDGVSGLVTVVGGKLTTYRLMAEQTADAVCRELGVDAECTTRDFVLPDPHHRQAASVYHTLGKRLEEIEATAGEDRLICECELVTRGQIEEALASHPDFTAPWVLDDLRRDLRLGMGPCQGGFCAVRAVGIMHERGYGDAAVATNALVEFVHRRWKGQRSLLWGQGLRQALLDEVIYRETLGLPAQSSVPTLSQEEPDGNG